MTKVTIRPVEERDFTFMHDTLYKTWFEDEHDNEELAYALAEIDLNQFLNRGTFGLVAEAAGEAVGFILAKVNKEEPVFRQLQSDPYKPLITILNAPAELQKENGEYLKREKEVNSGMVEESETSFDAEICLFIVNPSTRGMGIGQRLFGKVKEHFESQDVEDYYLFTDDGCDYKFYEKQQMHRSQSRPLDKLDRLEESSFNFYFYENN